MPRAGNAILDIDHAPLAVQPLTIRTAESGAAAVIHVEHPPTARGVVLHPEAQVASGAACGSAVGRHEQPAAVRPAARCTLDAAADEIRIRSRAVRGREADRLRRGKGPLGKVEFAGGCEGRGFSRGDIEFRYSSLVFCAAADERDACGGSREAPVTRESGRQRCRHASLDVGDDQRGFAVRDPLGNDVAGSRHDVVRGPERPHGQTILGIVGDRGAHAGCVVDMQVPVAAPVGHIDQAVVSRPRRLIDRLVDAAGHQGVRTQSSGGVDVRHDELPPSQGMLGWSQTTKAMRSPLVEIHGQA